MTRTLELLDRLIAFPTISSASNLDLVGWAQSLLQGAGFDVTRLPSTDGTKAGLHARMGPDTNGGICLSGHTDVVPSEGQIWQVPAFELTRAGARVHGRGTTDMKGFVASALAAAERAQATPLKAPLSLVLSYDEEIGCIGLRDMLPALTPLLGQPNLVIVGEPTNMQIATGHKGKAALELTCKGEAGHSALAPNFVNAIHVAAQCVTEIRALQIELAKGPCDRAYDVPYTTVHVGKIAGGQALNIVPDLVHMDMEFRHLAQTSAQDMLDRLTQITRRVDDMFGLPGAVTLTQRNAYPGLDCAASGSAFDLAKALTSGSAGTKVAFGTEAGYFAQLGLDALVIGPGVMDTDGHKPDEGLDLAQLAACDAMMDRVLSELAA